MWTFATTPFQKACGHGSAPSFIGAIIMIVTVIYMFIGVILPVGVLFFIVQRFYVSTSRQLKRLESISRSPIYSHFGESLQGSSTIRAFGMEKEFINQSQTLVDKNQVSLSYKCL